MGFETRGYPKEVPDEPKSRQPSNFERDTLRNPDRGQEEWDRPASPTRKRSAEKPHALDDPYQKPFEREKIWLPRDPNPGPSTPASWVSFMSTLSPAQKAMKASLKMIPLLGSTVNKELTRSSDLKTKLALVNLDSYLEASGNPSPDESMAVRTIAELIDYGSDRSSANSLPSDRAIKSLAIFSIAHPEAKETIEALVQFHGYPATHSFERATSRLEAASQEFGI